MAERPDLYSRGVSTASEHDPNFAPVAALLSNPTNLHITFVKNLRYNSRTHDAPDRIARCLIGQHGRLRLRELFA
jgi:hypothetical protein